MKYCAMDMNLEIFIEAWEVRRTKALRGGAQDVIWIQFPLRMSEREDVLSNLDLMYT